MATANYYVGPQDGWVAVTTSATKSFLRISAFPHTHPIYVFGGTVAPAVTDVGVAVCHNAFKIAANADANTYYVRLQNPTGGSRFNDGRARIDVITDGVTA